MFERFTDGARRVVVLAQEEARHFEHAHIGTEHLLLGLLGERSGLGAHALSACGLTSQGAQRAVEDRVGRGSGPATRHLPFTPRAKKVLEFSLREALKLGHNSIGTEHLLLALVAEGEGVAAQILRMNVGGGLEAVRRATLQMMAAEGVEVKPPTVGLEDPDPKALNELLRSVVARLEAIEARLSEIERSLRERDEGSEAS